MAWPPPPPGALAPPDRDGRRNPRPVGGDSGWHQTAQTALASAIGVGVAAIRRRSHRAAPPRRCPPGHQLSHHGRGLPRHSPRDRPPVDALSPHLGDHPDEAKPPPRPPARMPGPRSCWRASRSSASSSWATPIAPRCRSPAGGQYLKPGAWFDGLRYGNATESAAELAVHPSGTTSARPSRSPMNRVPTCGTAPSSLTAKRWVA